MGKQFSLIATDVDLGAIERLLRPSVEAYFFSTEVDDSQHLKRLDDFAIPPSQAGKTSVFCYLAREQYPAVVIKSLGSKVTVDYRESELVEVWRPFFDGKIIKRGRFFYEPQFFHAKGQKSPEFCKWAEKLFERVKRLLRYNRSVDAYVGRDAAEAIDAGRIAIVSALNSDSIVRYEP